MGDGELLLDSFANTHPLKIKKKKNACAECRSEALGAVLGTRTQQCAEQAKIHALDKTDFRKGRKKADVIKMSNVIADSMRRRSKK